MICCHKFDREEILLVCLRGALNEVGSSVWDRFQDQKTFGEDFCDLVVKRDSNHENQDSLYLKVLSLF